MHGNAFFSAWPMVDEVHQAYYGGDGKLTGSYEWERYELQREHVPRGYLARKCTGYRARSMILLTNSALQTRHAYSCHILHQ